MACMIRQHSQAVMLLRGVTDGLALMRALTGAFCLSKQMRVCTVRQPNLGIELSNGSQQPLMLKARLSKA